MATDHTMSAGRCSSRREVDALRVCLRASRSLPSTTGPAGPRLEEWLKYEEERWRCSRCGLPTSWYDVECIRCGEARSERLFPRVAPELALKTRKPGRWDRVAAHDSWLSEAERGGFAHLAAQAAVLASQSGSARTARCSTVQRDCRADARALAGSESPQTLLGAASWCLAGSYTERGDSNPRYRLRGTTVFEASTVGPVRGV